jgi:signal transduction histidine kinase/CheY-like chemotaxis protein
MEAAPLPGDRPVGRSAHLRLVAEPGVLGGHFRALRLLKEGQGVATWLGSDARDGSTVVIKVADTAGAAPGALLRLEHEAEILRQVRSPYLTPLLYAGRDEERFYLVLPCVPGRTLADLLRRRPLSVQETLAVGLCVFSALEAAHQHGVLHRDVKPANVIVDEGEPVTQATLIDFGLALSTRLAAGLRDLPAGSACYMSPEQAGLLEYDVGPRSDLYSGGILLYECLAGRPPFRGESLAEVLRQHVTRPHVELRRLGLAVPRALDEILARLLRKDPRERYQTAAAVVADLEDLRQALQQGLSDPVLVVGRADRRASLAEPAFVGRRQALETLEAALEQARQGRGGLVTVAAPSGGGKTRLLEELSRAATRQGSWALRGGGRDQIALLPFQVLEGVAAELLQAALVNPQLGRDLRQRLGDHDEAVAAALPQLAPLLGGGPPAALGPEAHGEVRSLRALEALLVALGSPARPALVFLDDCQWADELSVRLLQSFAGRARQGDCFVLVVVAYRCEEVPPEHPLRRLEPLARLELRPFVPEEVRDLVESMAGPVPQVIHETVGRLSEGNPFMAAEVLRGLVETGALVAEPQGWRVETSALAEVQSSRRAACLLARRLELLPPATRELLALGALLGKSFQLDVVARLAGQEPGECIRRLDEARRRHLVWADARGSGFTFVHDRLREALLGDLPAARRRQMHAAAAACLEELDPGRIFEIAYHFDQAGEAARALPYALHAAEQARERSALEIAEQHYRIALRGAAGADPALRLRITRGLGWVLMLRGRYREARERLEEARDLATGPLDQAEIEGKLGELAFKGGDMEGACQALQRGLALLGRPVPRTRAGYLLALGGQILVQLGHTLWPRLFLGRRPLARADRDLLAVRLYSRLAYAYWFQRGALPTLWAHLCELNLAERYPPTRELGQAYANHGPCMTMLPLFRRAIAYGHRSVAIRTSLGDLWGRGQSLHFLGVALLAAGRLREALSSFREAVRLLERTGDRWEVNAARYHVALALYRLGELKEAAQTARQVHRDGLEIGDSFAAGASLNILAKASAGRVSEEVLAAELARPSLDHQRQAEVWQAEGLRLLGCDRCREAAQALDRAWQIARKAGLRTEYVASIPAWRATALRRALQGLLRDQEGEGPRLLHQARRAARTARLWALFYPNNRPHALREAAFLEAAAGRLERARRLLDQSLRWAERLEMLYERALTLQARGELGQALLWPGAARDLALAGRDLALRLEFSAAEEPPVTLSLADRFDQVLEVGRRLAGSLTREAVYQAVREAALSLLRGEECLILEVPPEAPHPSASDLTPVAGDPRLPYSRSAASLALDSGRAVVVRDLPEQGGQESVILQGVRSALCAPIVVAGRAVACFYVLSTQVSRLFGEDEERLAGYISALAAAALQNAEGLARQEALSLSLQAANQELQASLRRLQEAQEQLLHSERMAVAGRVAGSLAHDFNNLLTVVNGCAGLLLADLDPADPRRREAEDILEAGQRGAALTRQLLAFSRRQVLRPRPLDLNAVVEGMVGMIRRLLGEDIEVQTRLAPGLGAVLADPTQMEQVLMNLAVNARDAMPGGGRLLLETSPVELEAGSRGIRPGSYVVLTVADTGCGMDQATRARIFEPFFTTKEPGRGTGLGLATVYGIVEQSGGHIEVDSAPGQGTTFRLYFPCVAQAVSESPAGEPRLLPRGLGTVLLVEDEPSVRNLAHRVLARSGYTVLLAGDGQQALELAQSHPGPIDLVLTDVVMPGMSDPELVRRLADLRPGLKILYMSGYPDEDLMGRGLSGERPAVVAKPFSPAALARQVGEMLQGGGPSAL